MKWNKYSQEMLLAHYSIVKRKIEKEKKYGNSIKSKGFM